MNFEPASMVGFFVLILSLVFGSGWAFLAVRRRSTQPAAPRMPSPLDSREEELPGTRAFLARTFRLIGEAVPGAQSETNPVRSLLEAAGHRWSSALSIHYGVKCASAAVTGLLLGWSTLLLRDDLLVAAIAGVCGAGVGYLMPDRLLALSVRARSNRIRLALPSMLDLLVLGVEAGQPVDQALLDCSRELRGVYPDLSAELAVTNLELRAGKSRVEVLHRLGQRNREPELRKLTALLIDSDRFGTSLGPALRSHARYLRVRRRQTAQEAARKLSVKLVFPVFFLIFPSVLMITLGPAVIRIYSQLIPLLGD